jgi:hypothetical protein
MRQFVIERELPGAHQLTPAELKADPTSRGGAALGLEPGATAPIAD